MSPTWSDEDLSPHVAEHKRRFLEAYKDENGQPRTLHDMLCVALEMSEDKLDSNILSEVVALRLTAERCDREHERQYWLPYGDRT